MNRLFLTAAAVLVGLLVAPAAEAATLYPDLQTLPPRDFKFQRTDTNTGMQNVLRFSNTTWNAGEGALAVNGTVDPTKESAPAMQTLFDDTGFTRSIQIGSYTIHREHQHYHYDDWGHYELWTKAAYDKWVADGRPSVVKPYLVGKKTTSCILDEEFVAPLPKAVFPNVYPLSGCDPTAEGKIDSGLSVGWGDTYDWDRYDQWLELGDQWHADGDYVVRSVADPFNKIHESANAADVSRESVTANEGIAPLRISAGVIVDLERPTATVTMNALAKTTSSTNVTARIIGRDDVSGVTGVRLSNDGVTWRDYAYGGSGSSPMSVQWDLADTRYGGSTASGVRTLYVQVRDATGKLSPSLTDTIELTTGTTPPPPPADASDYSRRVLQSGPVAYWRLGEASGVTAKDVVGAHDGRYAGSPLLGRPGLLNSDTDKAAQFTGTSSVQVADSAALSPTAAVSVEAWIKPDALPVAGDFASVVTSPNAYSLQFNGPRIEFALTQSGARRRLQAPAGAIVVGQRYHVMGTYDGAVQRLYINGAQVGSAALTGAIDNGPGLNVGEWEGNEFFRGTIDEPAVYDKALTALGAKNHYDVGIAQVVGVASPSGLTATADSQTRVRLTWADNSSNETKFVIERSASSTFTSPTRFEVGAGVTTYNDDSVVAASTYHYRVRAESATEQSGWTASASATTPGTTPPPPATPATPTGVSAAATSSSSINVTWTDAATNETGYVLERSTSSTFTSPTAISLPAGSTSRSDTGLSPSTAYYYRVRAVNGTALSAWSSTATATTSAAPVTAPAAPSGLTATAASSSAISVSWVDNATDETGYVLERSTSSTFTSPTAITLPAGTTSRSDTGLSPSTTYYYRVRAVKSTLFSAWSATAVASTSAAPVTAPAAPSGLTATAASTSSIALTWVDNATDETGYVLERSTASTFTSPTAISLPAGATSHTDSGLAASTAYHYRVRAVKSGVFSAWSPAASATTQTPTTPPPTGETYAASVAADLPVSHWRLGETVGTAAADVRAANPGVYRNGTLLGAVSLLSRDTANRAAGFDGTNDFVEIADRASLDFTSAFTLEAWIKPTAIPATGGWASVLSKSESYSIQFNGPRLEFTVMQNSTRRRLQAPAGAVAVGGTYHVVATYDGAVQRLYLNGREVANRAQTGPATITAWPLAIGSWSGWGENFRGTVDEVAVYNKVLTPARVAAHSTAGGTTVATAAARKGKTRSVKRTTKRVRETRLGPAQRRTWGRKGPGARRTRALPRFFS